MSVSSPAGGASGILARDATAFRHARQGPFFATDPAAIDYRGDSWGGWAIVALVLSALAHPVVRRLIDGAHVVDDREGRSMIVQNSQVSTLVGVFFFVAAALFAARACLDRSGRTSSSVFAASMQVLVLWWAVLSVLIPRKPGGLDGPYLLILAAPVLVFGVVSRPPTEKTLARVNLLRDLFAGATIAYTLLVPEFAQRECRDDKCGILGTMATGFFTQENTAPAFMSLLLPLAAASPTPARFALSSGLALFVALASGSRTGIATTALAVLVAWYVRRRTAGGANTVAVSDAIAAIPLMATMASLALFLTADPEAFTGRGRIYAAVREALHGMQMLYGIPWNTVLLATDGTMASQHGQAPHVLAKAGLVGFALWLLAMIALLFFVRFGRLQFIGLGVLVAGSISMLTESAFELDERSTGFLALVIAIGLLSAPPPPNGTQRLPWPVFSRLRNEATTVALVLATGLAVLAILVLSPPTYRASTTMSFTSNTDDAEQSRDGLGVAQVRAETFARITTTPSVVERALAQSRTPMSVTEAIGAIETSRRELATVVTVSFRADSPDAAHRMNDALVNETLTLARRLETTDAPVAGIRAVSLGTSSTTRIPPLTDNGAAVATSVLLGLTLAWRNWRSRGGGVIRGRHAAPEPAKPAVSDRRTGLLRLRRPSPRSPGPWPGSAFAEHPPPSAGDCR